MEYIKKKTKKGFAPLFAIPTLIFAGIVLLMVFIFVFGFLSFLKNNLFVILAVGLLLGGFIFLLRPGGNQKFKTTIFLVLISVAVLFAFGGGFLEQTFGGLPADRYVEIPVFGYIECKNQGLTDFTFFDVSRSGEWITHDLPENTDNWNINLLIPKLAFLDAPRQLEYYICNSENFNDCPIHITDPSFTSQTTSAVKNLGQISSKEHIWIQLQKKQFLQWKEDDKHTAQVKYNYNPFALWRSDPFRGSDYLETEGIIGCELPTSSEYWRGRVTSSDADVKTWDASNPLETGQSFNYVTTKILSVKDGNTQSGGWCIWEDGQATVYEIEEVQLGDGTKYNRVNTNNAIGTPECCTGESYPGATCQDGNLIPISQAECSQRSDCRILDFFETGDREVGRYQCIEGDCVVTDKKDVECTSQFDCKSNEFCSQNTWTCKLAGEGPGGEGVEIEDENGEAEIEKCSPLEELVDINKTYKKGFLSIFGIGKEVTETFPVCKTKDIVKWVIIGSIIFTLGLVAILSNRPQRKSSRRRR